MIDLTDERAVTTFSPCNDKADSSDAPSHIGHWKVETEHTIMVGYYTAQDEYIPDQLISARMQGWKDAHNAAAQPHPEFEIVDPDQLPPELKAQLSEILNKTNTPVAAVDEDEEEYLGGMYL